MPLLSNFFKKQLEKEKNAWRKLKKSPITCIRSTNGISMMVAISALMVIMYIAMEITYDSTVDYTVNSQNFNRIKAYYAAKSGIDLALLRIKIYQKVSSQFGEQLGSNASMLDEIWRLPFAWPLPIPAEMSTTDKDSLKSTVKDAFMDANFMTTIEDEGSKIDLNDLVSKSKVLRETAKKQMLSIFESERKQNEDFDKKYSGINFEDLVNQITNYMSRTSESAGGGDKISAFSELNSEAQANIFPPNRSFRSLSEMRFIPLMTDDIYELLEPRVTIYGMKGINPNLATKEVLRSLDPGLTSEIVDQIVSRRTDINLGGPFQSDDDFWSFAQAKGARLEGDKSSIPLIFDTITNFRIRSSGEFAGAMREISAIVMDIDRIALKVAEQIKKEEKEQNADPNAQPSGGAASTPKAAKKKAVIPKGPPRIVWWNEK